MTKQVKQYLSFGLFLLILFVSMVLIGANIPYTEAVAPDPVTSLQKFVEFCIKVKEWFGTYAILLGLLAAALFGFIKFQPKKRRK